jgi:hypothetical protein
MESKPWPPLCAAVELIKFPLFKVPSDAILRAP